MKNYYGIMKKILFLLALALYANQGFAQQRAITGRITDSGDEMPIPGVSVIVKGTNIGTITDLDGNFTIQASNTDMLVITYIGYTTQEITVGNSSEILVSMETADIGIDEVLVVGYGTQKKSDKTGAVANITAKELNGGALTDPIQGLQGKTAGVLITKKGGDPNSGYSVKIRGSAGIITAGDPLYVIDGVPGADPTTVASEDIESYNVLKDASSTAIYGSRGANGVIMITTKKGTGDQRTSVEFNSYLSIDQVAKKLDMMNAGQIRQYVSEKQLDFVDGGSDVDWQDQIYRQGQSKSYTFAVSGGNKTTNYRLSANHNDYIGVINGSDKKRTIGRLNINTKGINDKLSVQATISGTFENNNYVKYDGNGRQDVIYQAIQRNPTDPVYNTDGSFYEFQRDFQYYNPVAIINDLDNGRDAKNFLGNLKADFEIISGLSAGINLGYIRNDADNFFFEPSYTATTTTQGYASRRYNNFDQRLLEATLTYNKTLNSVHNINAVFGYSYQLNVSNGFGVQGREAQSDFVKYNNLGALNDVKYGDIYSYKNSFKLISFFGRAIYNYNSKYYLTATIRRDGSSKFGTNNEWGIFPSASVAWNIKNESFLEGVEFISMLKIRSTYGLAGSQELGPYFDQDTKSPRGQAPNPETGELVIKFEGDRNPNPDLKWEENKEMNVGFDFGILNNRIQGTFDYYIRTKFDLIAGYEVPLPPNKYRTTFANAGQIDNKGFEINIMTTPVSQTNLDWKSNLSFSSNKQTVVTLENDLYDLTEIKEGWLSGRGLVGDQNWTQIVKPGVDLGTFYMPEYAGLSSDGKFLFYTAAGGVTRNVADAERRIVGHAQPKFEVSWSNYLTLFKNIDFSFSIRALQGFDVLNVTRLIFANPSTLPSLNALTEALDESAKGLNDIPKVNSYYLEDGSFIKLDNVTLGYNFNIAKYKWLQKLRVYFTGNNLLTITQYKGLDPELSYQGRSFGLDQYNVYPKVRSYTFGLNVTF